MTKEECVALLIRHAEYDGMGIPNLDVCKEAMRMAAELLSRPSLPSDLDETAEKIASDIVPTYPDIGRDECFEKIKEGIKAGAEWMSKQNTRTKLSVKANTPEGKENYEKVATKMRQEIGLDEAAHNHAANNGRKVVD